MQRHVAAEIALRADGGLRGFFAPEPPERVGEDRPAVHGAVAVALGVFKMDIVAHVAQGGVHVFICDRPVAVIVVEIPAHIFEIDADGLALGLADQGRIGVAAAEIDETADGGVDLAKLIGPLPRGGEGRDAAAARAADRAHGGIFGNGKLFLDLGQNLFEEQANVAVAERIVFESAVARGGAGFLRGVRRTRGIITRIDHHGDRHGHFAASDQVFKYDGHAPVPRGRVATATVLEDHEGSGAVGFVAGRHVDPPVARGVREDLRVLPRGHLDEAAGGHAGLRGVIGRGLEAVGGEEGR